MPRERHECGPHHRQLRHPAVEYQPGQAANLRWSTSNAKGVSIDHGVGTAPPNGTRLVAPTATTTYTLTATGPGSSVQRSTTVTYVADPQYAEITVPGPDPSVLPGSCAQFSWTAGNGATQYHLQVGSSVGGTNYFNTNVGGARTQQVCNLPEDGSPVYVRLWSNPGGLWGYQDYMYSAASGPTANDPTRADSPLLPQGAPSAQPASLLAGPREPP